MRFRDTLRVAHRNRHRRNFPNVSDRRFDGTLLLPDFKPKFEVDFTNGTIFTIGSCFARNVEEVLAPKGVSLPTAAFSVPSTEWAARPNGLLNEFNPGTIAQRILFALKDQEYSPETIVPSGDLFVDLLLLGGNPVTYARAIERRKEIAAVYKYLKSSKLLILTLGLTEAWFDKHTGMYLNQMPPIPLANTEPERYEFRRLDVFDCVPILQEAVDAAAAAEVKILMTVSPVPLQTTFTNSDCVVANEFSKAALRVTAERLSANPYVDYFPSYEIVRSGGRSSYIDDLLHVRNDVVEIVINHMLANYNFPSTDT